MACFIFLYFLLLASGHTVLILLSLIASFTIFHSLLWGPEAALIAEQFPTRYRYSGASVGAQLAAPISGGMVPIIAVALLKIYHGSFVPVALLVVGIAIISALSLLGMQSSPKL
jgi:sugar phosphate permease